MLGNQAFQGVWGPSVARFGSKASPYNLQRVKSKGYMVEDLGY